MGKELSCPFCRSKKMRKAGYVSWPKGKGMVRRQRWECKNCRRMTVKPRGL